MGGCWGRVSERRSYPNPEAANSYATSENSESQPNAKPKNIVPIPVNFVNSETFKSKGAPAMVENTAVVKIQAAFRGFCVRKPRPLNKLRVIMTIKAEVAEIRRRVNDESVVDLLARDENEGLKMTEQIMSLLLRLDGIQGAIPFVRGSRKAVIRELVNLQSTVDDIIAGKTRQNAVTEISVKSEAEMEEFRSKEMPGGAIEISVSNQRAEEYLSSQMQIEGSPKGGVEIFEKGSCGAGQIVSGTEECAVVDVVDKAAENLKRRKCSRKNSCTE